MADYQTGSRVALYSHALNEAEIATLYKAGQESVTPFH
jgi:hypothetical protein